MGVIKDLQKVGKMGNAARSTMKRLHGAEVVASQLKLAFEKTFTELKRRKE